jgi:hypothetical protein
MTDPVRRRWQPRPLAIGAAFGAIAVLLWVAATAGSQARVLAGGAAMLLGIEAARSLARRPALSVDETGLRVLTGWRHVTVPWDSVVRVHAVRAGRLVPTSALEIDVDSTVFVLAGYQLGEEPAAVATAVEALRSARTGNPNSARNSGDEGT